jgi:hypothetical protein
VQPRSSTALFGTGEVRIERFGWIFCPGDKVMQVENDYDMEVYNRDLDVVSRIDSRKVSSSLEVNLFGAYHCARLAIPHLRRRGGGKNHRNRFRSRSQRFDPADLSIGHRLIGTSLHYWGDQTNARHHTHAQWLFRAGSAVAADSVSMGCLSGRRVFPHCWRM